MGSSYWNILGSRTQRRDHSGAHVHSVGDSALARRSCSAPIGVSNYFFLLPKSMIMLLARVARRKKYKQVGCGQVFSI